jgi:hypothetical protein
VTQARDWSMLCLNPCAHQLDGGLRDPLKAQPWARNLAGSKGWRRLSIT